MANLGGQEGSGKRIFFAWLNGQVGQEGQELDLDKFPRTSPEGSEDRLGELAGGRREGPALEGPARGAGADRARAGGKAASEPSLLAGLRAAAAQMLFCERARLALGASWPQRCTGGAGGS